MVIINALIYSHAFHQACLLYTDSCFLQPGCFCLGLAYMWITMHTLIYIILYVHRVIQKHCLLSVT